MQTSGRCICGGGKQIYENGAEGRMAADWNSPRTHLTENSWWGNRLAVLNWMEVWTVIAAEPGYCNRSSSLKAAVLKTRKAPILGKNNKCICTCPCSKIKPSPCRQKTWLTPLFIALWEPKGWRIHCSLPAICTNFQKEVSLTVRTQCSKVVFA